MAVLSIHGRDIKENNPSYLRRQVEAEDDGDRDRETFLVKFEDNDLENPRSFSSTYKGWLVFQLSLLTMAGSLASAIMAPSAEEMAEYLNIHLETTSLTVALFILGMQYQMFRRTIKLIYHQGWAFGPILWAPISETYGRRWGVLPAVFLFSVFSLGTAVATNATSVFVTRFLGGVFASAPISNSPASLGDIYTPEARGTANAIMAFCIAGGLSIGPVVGSFLSVDPRLGWRCEFHQVSPRLAHTNRKRCRDTIHPSYLCI